jgi:hypothetical protein
MGKQPHFHNKAIRLEDTLVLMRFTYTGALDSGEARQIPGGGANKVSEHSIITSKTAIRLRYRQEIGRLKQA